MWSWNKASKTGFFFQKQKLKKKKKLCIVIKAHSRSPPAFEWPFRSSPSCWPAPPRSLSPTRSLWDTSSPLRSSLALPLPQLQVKSKYMKKKINEDNTPFKSLWLKKNNLPSSTRRRCNTSKLEMRLYSLKDKRSDGLDWLLGSAWALTSPFLPFTCPFTAGTWPFTPLGMLSARKRKKKKKF